MTICFVGPSFLLGVAHLAQRWLPVASAGICVAVASILIVAAAWLGQIVPGLHDFTRGMLALFVCWSPQLFVLIAFLQLWSQRSRLMRGYRTNE